MGDKTSCQQQTRLSQLFRQHGITAEPSPHRQFILDFQAWVSHMQTNKHEVIIALDANEAYDPDSSSSSHPLPFTPAKPTVDPSHNGKLSTLISTCNLLDPFALQHPEQPFPESHAHGTNRIDYILITPGIRSAILRSGCLPFHSLFQGDHRPYFLDLSVKHLFRNHTHEIQRPSYRLLTLHNPRKTAKYKEELHYYLKRYNIYDRCSKLKTVSEEAWTDVHTSTYLQLDHLITKAMIQVERKV
jgi:hypothetical protein